MHKLTEKLLTLEKCALKVKLMFESSVYTNRRRALMALMAEKATNGVVIFLGNNEAPMAYRGNDYKFRQDSSFLYSLQRTITFLWREFTIHWQPFILHQHTFSL